MDMQRKKPQVSTGRPSTAEAASYPHYLGRGRHKSLQRGNMSGKTSSPQGSCSPAHSQACSFSSNKASPLSESTQHSCQDHKYNEVPSKASSRQDGCSPSTCQAQTCIRHVAFGFACLLLFSHVFTGHRALGRLEDIAWLGHLAGQSAMRVAGVHIPCMGTCMVTLAVLLALLGWHIFVMT